MSRPISKFHLGDAITGEPQLYSCPVSFATHAPGEPQPPRSPNAIDRGLNWLAGSVLRQPAPRQPAIRDAQVGALDYVFAP